jgi:hypothetical protein
MTGGDQAPDCEISPFATAARLDLISATLSERSALTMAARATAVIAFMRKRLSRKFGPNKKSGCVITVTAFDRSRVII